MTIAESILGLLNEGPACTFDIHQQVGMDVQIRGGRWAGWPPFDHSVRGCISRLLKAGKIVRIGPASYALPKLKSQRKRLRAQAAA